MTATGRKPNELHITRFYAAPVDAVWDAWTDPEQVAQWWGPRGFTLTTHSKDLRVGGHWHYTMHGPDGTDYENTTKYFEVEKEAKLVYDHGGHADRPPLFRVTATFESVTGGTVLNMTMTFPTPEIAKDMAAFIRKAGGNGTWDRLGEFLEKRSSGREIFVINRTFNAPISTLSGLWPENHVRLVEEDPGVTRVTVTQELTGPSPDAARADLARYWTDAFDRVEERLG